MRWGVALRKESVDRNRYTEFFCEITFWSLSARRAWIEMPRQRVVVRQNCVALRKESVDRNISVIVYCIKFQTSLSARRAWIKIPGTNVPGPLNASSLSARRAWIEIVARVIKGDVEVGRSPQGERG